MDELDAQLLDVLQTSVPLVAQPWRQVAKELGVDESDVLCRVRTLRESGVVRRIGGVFEATRLGYRQTLLAMAVEPEMLGQTAGVVAGHPGVSHCYSRDDEFNLWATLTVSPESALGLDNTAEKLARRCGAKSLLNLPARQRFKLDARLGKTLNVSPFCAAEKGGGKDRRAINDMIPLSDEQKRAVRALQVDLPVIAGPFDAIARREGFASDEELLVHAADLQTLGVLRRYAALVHHVRAGIKANVMVVWEMPDDTAQLAGATAAQCESISHCYLRNTAPDWPYNLYTMIHGPSHEDCNRIIESIAVNLNHPPRRELWTLREYKKSSARFFSVDEAEWENHLRGETPASLRKK